MALTDPSKTVNNTLADNTTNTQKCGPGQVLRDGVCVTLGMQGGFTATRGREGAYNPFPNGNPNEQTQTQTQTPNGLSQIYGNIRSGFQQATDTNIAAARQTAEMQQQELARQLEQQREDYLKNRQTLQRETFLRGRNVLANLANRGLATSGLQQLGDIQRTIATGQQMNELSSAFERARQGLTSQQTQVATGLQQFEAGQQSQLAQQLAGLDLQEQQAGVTEGERSVAYAESLATLLSDPAIPQATKDALAPLYESLITATPQTAADGTTTEGTGGLSQQLGTTTGPTTPQQFIDGMSNYSKGLTVLEKRKLNEVVNDSENLKQDSPFNQAISNKPDGFEITPSITTKGGKAGLNDTYAVTVDGTQYNLNGRELAVLIMNGKVKVSPQIAVSIVQRAGGRVAEVGGTTGNAYDSILRPYLEYLKEQGFISGKGGLFSDYKINIDNAIR